MESATDPSELVAHIDQKAVRLSALLRDIDNHPVEIDKDLSERLDGILEQLEFRIAATRALLAEGGPAEEPAAQLAV